MHRLPRAFRLRQQHILTPRLNKPVQRRLQSQTVYKSNGEPVRYQAVRFRAPGLTTRRMITLGLYAGCGYAYMRLLGNYFDIAIEELDEVEVEGEEEEEETAEEDGEGSFYADEDSTFIPMTWATKLPREFYRGSDPEWQEFVKIAKDKSRQREIRDELVSIVFSAVPRNPGVAKMLGTEAKVGTFWLDISFPDGPPPEYERSGIEIGDGFIAWSQQRITPENQHRLVRALWPTAAFDSSWATVKALANLQYLRLKEALGWQGADPFHSTEKYKRALDFLQKQQQAREGKGVGNAQTNPEGNSALVGSSGSSDAQSSRASSAPEKRLPWTFNVPLPSSIAANSPDVPIALHVFRSTLSKQWNRGKIEPPRGTFVVQGLVELRGSKGRMLCDVSGCYDPKRSKYVGINLSIRSAKSWKQVPKGGA